MSVSLSMGTFSTFVFVLIIKEDHFKFSAERQVQCCISLVSALRRLTKKDCRGFDDYIANTRPARAPKQDQVSKTPGQYKIINQWERWLSGWLRALAVDL